MCGIAGIVGFDDRFRPDLATLKNMCDTLIHRGPDGEGYDIHHRVGFGMRRLAVIDVEGGQQPHFNEDRTVRSVFNGEIYNYKDLRQCLQSQGHKFQSESDGEVLVHLWEEKGIDFLQSLNGMFAIALYDQRKNRVLLARDRLGIKPLYYALTDRGLIFGSEIKAILASGLIHPTLHLDGLGQFISWEYVPGRHTLFQGIYKLEPGSFLDLNLHQNKMQLGRWWEVPHVHSESFQQKEWEEKIGRQLRQSVRKRLVSDVPLGAFLSGGVDSSLIVSEMNQPKTFSIGFEDPSYNELQWSSEIAGHLGLEHQTEMIYPHSLELFDHLMHFMDDPIGDCSIFPTYLVSRLARESVTVVLSGDGGDEIFGGYETYLANRMATYWALAPSFTRKPIEKWIQSVRPAKEKKGWINKAKRFLEGFEHSDSLSHARWRLFLGTEGRKNLFTSDALQEMGTPVEDHIVRLYEQSGNRNDLDRSLYVDVKSYLCDNILLKVDRMSMACSLEARVPFLDHELVEMAFQMPDRFKISGSQTKMLLKKIASRRLPGRCVYRSKEGFSIPMKHWLNQELRPLVEDLLSETVIRQDGIFRFEEVNRLKTEHLSGHANHSHILWSMLVFQDWRRRWKVI